MKLLLSVFFPASLVPAVMFAISSEAFSTAITPLAVYFFNVSVLINIKVMLIYITFLPISKSKYKLNQIMPPL